MLTVASMPSWGWLSQWSDRVSGSVSTLPPPAVVTRPAMKSVYARALFCCDDATLDDRREAVATLEELERTARRVLGSAHPHVADIAEEFQWARETLSAGETPRGVGVEEDDDDSDEWETVSSEEAPTVATS